MAKNEKIHFIGVGGISMSALAKYCIFSGKTVSGSDTSFNQDIKTLRVLGAKIFIGHNKENVKDADVVVYSSAIKQDNEELQQAILSGKKIYKRSEFLGVILKNYSSSIAVCGSHGKTTTTAMISKIFIDACLDPTVFLGGESREFSNFKYGESDIVIAEACEYKKNFLDLNPKFTVMLNIDDDHLDYYNDLEQEVRAFATFISGTFSVYNKDDENCNRICSDTAISFGIKSDASFLAKNIKNTAEGCSFDLFIYNRKKARINLGVSGEHNVYNALASIIMADIFEIPLESVKKSLKEFNGVKRRAEMIGTIRGKKIYSDYAHHPTEISAVFSQFNVKDNKTLVVFQPHTYSRTKLLMEKFVSVLSRSNKLIIYRTYSAREDFDPDGSAFCLYNNIRKTNDNVVYTDTREELVIKLSENIDEVEAVLFMGAGDIYFLGKKILDMLK